MAWVANLVAATGSLVGRECECFVINDLPIDVSVNTYNAIDVVNPYWGPYLRYTLVPGEMKKCAAANGFHIKLRLHLRDIFSEVATIEHNKTIKTSELATTAHDREMMKYAEMKIPSRLLPSSVGVSYSAATCNIRNDQSFDVIVVGFPHVETTFDNSSSKAVNCSIAANTSGKISVPGLGRIWLKVISRGGETGMFLVSFDDVCSSNTIKVSTIIHIAPWKDSTNKQGVIELK
jgi:hypothetical protein